jgi:YVTN family beta-propeller protein
MKLSVWRLSALALSAVLTSFVASAQSSEALSGLINRDGIVYSSRTGKIYVVDSKHGTVVIVAPGRAAKTLKTGAGPVSIAVNEKTGRVYVANSVDRSVTVIDGDTDLVVTTVPTAARPYAIAVDEREDRVYVSNTFSDKLTVIDGKTNTATNLKTGSADAILVDAQLSDVYLLGYETDSLTVLHQDMQATAKLFTGATHLWGIVALGQTLYVSHVQDATVAAIDTGTHAVRQIATPAMPCALAVDVARGEIYVASYADGSVSAITARLGTVAWTVKMGGHPQALAVDTVRHRVYVADAQQGYVSVIDAARRSVLRKVTVSGGPYALAIDTKTHRVFAATREASPYAEIPGR